MVGQPDTNGKSELLKKVNVMVLEKSYARNRKKSLWIIYFSMYMTMLGRF